MKNKIKQRKFLLIVGVLVVGIITSTSWFWISSNSRDNQDLAKQKEMMTLVLTWGRLAAFPANATKVSIKTEGSSFTRSFRASFFAPKQDILDWIKKSPGINEAVPEKLSDNKIWYDIVPGDGANKAEVTIDNLLNTVAIYVSWN